MNSMRYRGPSMPGVAGLGACCLLFLVIALPVGAGPSSPVPRVPGTNEVERYECLQPLYRNKVILRERGDALLVALAHGQQVREWDPAHWAGVAAAYQVGSNIICALPAPPRVSLELVLTNGQHYRLGVGDDFVDLPEGHFELGKPAQKVFDDTIKQLANDLREEILTTPKPCTYVVGTIDDGGTLGGIARLFYGSANRWRLLYEANRDVIKNPDAIQTGMKLKIPKPPPAR
ncbi:MAG TPA: hypothetical protein VN625_05430 [Desulfuromonadaceae bacterium]|nr:hypothetical protein [Desulfuromonadaceae bacterium]